MLKLKGEMKTIDVWAVYNRLGICVAEYVNYNVALAHSRRLVDGYIKLNKEND